MKKLIITVLAISIISAFTLIGCSSQPTPQPQQIQQEEDDDEFEIDIDLHSPHKKVPAASAPSINSSSTKAPVVKVTPAPKSSVKKTTSKK